jgi:hypothetical protein
MNSNQIILANDYCKIMIYNDYKIIKILSSDTPSIQWRNFTTRGFVKVTKELISTFDNKFNATKTILFLEDRKIRMMSIY